MEINNFYKTISWVAFAISVAFLAWATWGFFDIIAHNNSMVPTYSAYNPFIFLRNML